MKTTALKPYDIKKHCYELYRLQWMQTHGYTRIDIMKKLDESQRNNKEKKVSKLFEDEFEDEGFNGSLWVCFEEFCDFEFKDKEYIRELLSVNKPDNEKYLKAYEKLIS